MQFWLLNKKQLQGLLSTRMPGGLFLLSGNGMVEARGTELTWATAGSFKKATGDFQECPPLHPMFQAGAAGEPHLGITERVTWKAGATVQPAPCTRSLHSEAVGSPEAKTGSVFPALP